MGPTLRQPVTRQAFYEYRPYFFEVFRFSRPIGESWLPKFDIEDNEITQHNFSEGHREMFNGHSAIFVLLLFTSVGCSTEQDPPNQRVEKAPTEVGSYFVANTTITVNDSIRSRALTLEIWYPSTTQAETTESPVNFAQSEAEFEALSLLYDEAPRDCPTRTTTSLRDGEPLAFTHPLPLILFSHCYNCGRFSAYSLAERLSSHGFVVIGVDHAGSLPFLEDAEGEMLLPEQLDTRVSDLTYVLSQVLSGDLLPTTPIGNKIEIDPDSIGAFGHSFGSVTTGFFAAQTSNIKAIAGLAAPMENPLFPGFKIEELSMPILFILAEEDNSIGEFGNRLIRSNYDAAQTEIWRVDIADAGHWSMSDLCGLVEAFVPGCGQGTRHSEQNAATEFDYLPVAQGIQITQDYLTAFFLAHLTQRQDALEYLNSPSADAQVNVHHRSMEQMEVP